MFLIASYMLHRACTSDLDGAFKRKYGPCDAVLLRRCLQYLRPL